MVLLMDLFVSDAILNAMAHSIDPFLNKAIMHAMALSTDLFVSWAIIHAIAHWTGLSVRSDAITHAEMALSKLFVSKVITHAMALSMAALLKIHSIAYLTVLSMVHAEMAPWMIYAWTYVIVPAPHVPLQ